jgi:WD40 repeat protein
MVPDGKRLVSGGFDPMVKVWDADKGQMLLTLEGHGERVSGVAFSPDGKHIARCSLDRMVKVWDADKEK